MGEIYNIVFDNALSTQGIDIDYFYFYWNKLPQGNYKTTFSFVSGTVPTLSLLPAMVNIDLGSSKIFFAGNTSNVGSSTTGNFIGFLKTVQTVGGNFTLCSSPLDNPPIYLDNLPAVSQVVIAIRASGGISYISDFPYVMTLSLEKI